MNVIRITSLLIHSYAIIVYMKFRYTPFTKLEWWNSHGLKSFSVVADVLIACAPFSSASTLFNPVCVQFNLPVPNCALHVPPLALPLFKLALHVTHLTLPLPHLALSLPRLVQNLPHLALPLPYFVLLLPNLARCPNLLRYINFLMYFGVKQHFNLFFNHCVHNPPLSLVCLN